MPAKILFHNYASYFIGDDWLKWNDHHDGKLYIIGSIIVRSCDAGDHVMIIAMKMMMIAGHQFRLIKYYYVCLYNVMLLQNHEI